jgi:dTDP-4-amino-4,6-dideoxygalactose transaminase
VEAFEAEVAEAAGTEFAVATSSGTAGLHLALLASGVQPGSDVLVPTLTFAATAFAVKYVGANPVFIDSEDRTYNVDPAVLEEALAGRTAMGRRPAAVISVDLFGRTADYAQITRLCHQFGVPLIEDAAEALGAQSEAGPAGSFGAAAVFSFNGNKIMTTSGGGMVVTSDASVAQRVRHLATQAREPVPWYEHNEVGFNYRMSNLLAALGRAQLRRLPAFIDRRRRIRDTYAEALEGLGVRILHDAPSSRGNGWLTVMKCTSAEQAVGVQRCLADEGIESRQVWKPMHLQPVFAGSDRFGGSVADDLFETGVCLPSGSSLSDGDVTEIIGLVTAQLRLEGSGCVEPILGTP